MKTLREYADVLRIDSLAAGFRRKRFVLFKALLSSLARPLTMLDVGGTQAFWESMDFTHESDIQVFLLNLSWQKVVYPNFVSVVGDARHMPFSDKKFDVVFSNSVLEHVGDSAQQRRMAAEVRRVGKRYFVQTPNRQFPVEPHFLCPLFQFLPVRFRVFLVSHFDLGDYRRTSDRLEAEEAVRSIRLLTGHELRELFPGGRICRERFLGLTKSFIVYDGWDRELS